MISNFSKSKANYEYTTYSGLGKEVGFHLTPDVCVIYMENSFEISISWLFAYYYKVYSFKSRYKNEK